MHVLSFRILWMQRELPWKDTPMSLSNFILTSMSWINQNVPVVNPFGTSFVVNPESNLPNIQKKIVPVLEDLSTKNSWNWKVVTGTLPTTEFMTSALIKKPGLFLYCGHGGGERFLSWHQIESLFKNEISSEKNPHNNYKISQELYSCNLSIILMGCHK